MAWGAHLIGPVFIAKCRHIHISIVLLIWSIHQLKMLWAFSWYPLPKCNKAFYHFQKEQKKKKQFKELHVRSQTSPCLSRSQSVLPLGGFSASPHRMSVMCLWLAALLRHHNWQRQHRAHTHTTVLWRPTVIQYLHQVSTINFFFFGNLNNMGLLVC